MPLENFVPGFQTNYPTAESNFYRSRCFQINLFNHKEKIMSSDLVSALFCSSWPFLISET